MKKIKPTNKLLSISSQFCDEIDRLTFSGPFASIYNPMRYAKKSFDRYINEFSSPPKRTIFMGMNPGPWGMAQTGVPFGEVTAVRDWLGIEEPIDKPNRELPGRPVNGFSCTRSEVSGRRVWGLMKKRFSVPEEFFKGHFIANYCPLIFFGGEGKNITPDKLNKADKEALFDVCDRYSAEMFELWRPEYAAGFGVFAVNRLESVRALLKNPVRQNLK